jgi:hypothetical protein
VPRYPHGVSVKRRDRVDRQGMYKLETPTRLFRYKRHLKKLYDIIFNLESINILKTQYI